MSCLQSRFVAGGHSTLVIVDILEAAVGDSERDRKIIYEKENGNRYGNGKIHLETAYIKKKRGKKRPR